MPGEDKTMKTLTPAQWDLLNKNKGYIKAKVDRPSPYAEYYDPKQRYIDIAPNGDPIIKPFISYTGQHHIPQISPDHKPIETGPNLTYNPNTGQYFNPVTQKAVEPIVEQYRKGGFAQKFNEGGGAYNERFNSANVAVDEAKKYDEANGDNSYQSTNKTKGLASAAASGLGTYGNSYYSQQEKNQGNDVMSAIGNSGTIGGVVAGISAIGDQLGAPIKNRSELMDDKGNLLDQKAARRNANIGMTLAPHKRLGVKGGFGFDAAENYVNDLETEAKDKIRAERADDRSVQYGLAKSNIAENLAQRDAGITGLADNFKGKYIPDDSDLLEDPYTPSAPLSNKDRHLKLANASQSFNKGGKVEGKGTSTSDSIAATVEDGSFIVPAENAGIAEQLRATVLNKNPNKKANLKTGDVPIDISDGEHVFTPEEAQELAMKGIDLNQLAPEAKTKLRYDMNFAKGGPVKKDDPNQKAYDRDLAEAMNRNNKYVDPNQESYDRDLLDALRPVDSKFSRENDPNQISYDKDMQEALYCNGDSGGKGYTGQGLSSILNYALPAAQGIMGLRAKKDAGARPIQELDPAYLSRIDQAENVANRAGLAARYGFTGDEKAQLNMNNAAMTNSGRSRARNLAGGSLADAYNLERGIINDNNDRTLANTIADNALKLRKQEYSDSTQGRIDNLLLNKVNMSNRLFDRQLGAWHDNVGGANDLISASLSNAIGAKRLNDEIESQKQTKDIRNNWFNGI